MNLRGIGLGGIHVELFGGVYVVLFMEGFMELFLEELCGIVLG